MSDNRHAGTAVSVEPCSDVALLSALFLELAEDEGSDIPRTAEKAAEEMEDYLRRGEKAYIFRVCGEIAGYALVILKRTPPYLHHFHICREKRRKGYGTAAFQTLIETLDIKTMDLDVFDWNERGKSFWRSLGFKPRAVIMRYAK